MKELYEINEEAYPFKNGNAYAYDMLGNRTETTDALGNTTFRSYDPFGNITAEWGATYPVRYTYDTQNRRTSLATTRDGTTWDMTRWVYDTVTGLCSSKNSPDDSVTTYTYTLDGLLLRETKSNGVWKEYVYDEKKTGCRNCLKRWQTRCNNRAR